jgi:N6-L-threonylcarbamoyladenine synthase
MLVFVLSKNGKPLMPTNSANARLLLKNGKAIAVKRTPFTIQLTYSSNSYKQNIALGVDTGYKNVGVSAATDTKELFSATAELRTDIVKLLSERLMYRRSKRSKLRYRKARFLNRGNKSKGWLAPSVQHRLDSHIKLINFIKSILPITQINVEAAAFDIQKINNPEISGVDYQNGAQKDFWNIREYVLYRDGHTCQANTCKHKDKILNIHHIESRQTGGDRPDNLITLCETCHKDYHNGKIKLDIKKHKSFKAETIMSILRWKIVNKLRELGNIVNITYGYITKSARIALGLDKSHSNDAFCVAGGNIQEKLNQSYFIKFVRKCNRSLFKANLLKGGKRKVNAIKQSFGFHRFDKVLYNKIECFIYGLRSSGYFDIRHLTGEKISASAKYTNLKLIETFKTRRIALLSAPIGRGIRAMIFR